MTQSKTVAAAARAAIGAAWLGAAIMGGGGCGQQEASPPSDSYAMVISGRSFNLELALTAEARRMGLSGRANIPKDGGMLFVFPRDQTRVQMFVMRDCLTPIDIIFLDPSGRITAMHQMKIEPRKEGESDLAYERRLKRYPSRAAAQFAIELAGGTLPDLRLSVGQQLQADWEGLAARAK